MIRYALACDQGHGFDAWFGSSGSYDEQSEAHAIVCPACGSHAVSKAPMAPNLAKGVPAPKTEASPAASVLQPPHPDGGPRKADLRLATGAARAAESPCR